RAQGGDEQAKESLVVHNIALVKSIVRGYLRRGVDYEDLMQIGSMGLLKAIDGYNASFGVRFSTYAVPMISGEIKRFLRDDGAIKVSRVLKENAIKIYRMSEQHKKKTGRDPTLSEIAAATGLEKEDVVHALEASRDPLSLEEPVFAEGEATLMDTLAVPEETALMDRLLIGQLLDRLNERERQVILLRFYRDKTQSEIARIIGVSQVQVSRILSKTLAKLKEEAL
ncbi:MAG: SigB/SigF/SigG family RNA polymerase sigma factor, partial [Christensenellaceae bacterium]|nr:SigB/SigF/SigG family RNA polymerase sigma factor [Christensenellaceae bacterium]